MPQPNESEQFKNEFEQEGVPVPKDLVVEEIEKQDENPELAPESIKDRRHRRLEKQLQESREMNIAITERLKALSETNKFKEEVAPDEDVHRMLYGNIAETPETKAAALAVQRVLEKQASTAEERAYKRAVAAFQEQNQAETREIEENTQYLESELENIEDSFGVDLSGETEESKKIRNGFIDYVAKLSRKDREGNIVDYPDITSTWEEYQNRRERSTSRNKQVAARSMTQSAGGDAGSEAERKALEKYMLEKGFI